MRMNWQWFGIVCLSASKHEKEIRNRKFSKTIRQTVCLLFCRSSNVFQWFDLVGNSNLNSNDGTLATQSSTDNQENLTTSQTNEQFWLSNYFRDCQSSKSRYVIHRVCSYPSLPMTFVPLIYFHLMFNLLYSI